MKRIGIIGGLSAESTTQFYSALTREYVQRFGEANYPEIVVFSVRFQTFMNWVKLGEWNQFTEGLVTALRALEAAGADFAVISANLPHIVFDLVEKQTSLPLLHIADPIVEEAQLKNYRSVALIGTQTTMGATFYADRLRVHGIDCIIPSPEQQLQIQEILDTELFKGIVTTESEQKYIEILSSLKEQGAEAVILGCTEIPLLISDQNSPLPVLDSTQLFVLKTLETALQGDHE